MKNYKLDAWKAGNDFTSVVKKAKNIAAEKGLIVEFGFNGVCCLVNENTNIDRLYRDYSNSWTMEWETVGPDCVEKYSDELQADLDNRIKLREEKRAKEREEYQAQEKKEKEDFEAATKDVELELKNAEGWKKAREINSDGYGGAALDYAEGWAKLMQIEMAKGKTLIECADYTQKGVSFLGITGFQYGAAVSTLAQTWKYGEELRRWHNSKYGVKDDSPGTVNPAVLTIIK